MITINVTNLAVYITTPLEMTSTKSQNQCRKYHERWYYFAAQWHFGDVLHTEP